jgi:hypothetical protein
LKMHLISYSLGAASHSVGQRTHDTELGVSLGTGNLVYCSCLPANSC